MMGHKIRDGSNDESQNMFCGEKWVIIPELSLLPILIWSAHVHDSDQQTLRSINPSVSQDQF